MSEEIRNSIKQLAIESIVKLLDGANIMPSQLFFDARMFAEEAEETHAGIEDKTVANRAKHKEVREKLMFLFANVADTVFDLAIKLAVIWLKTKIK